ncbi:MAG TPA: iron-containing alcohol dehydrogenase [Streptosporangiaceae bacterium]|nr:iron-containing alcohol dehydrogenase [Streptosporangiaceae bacterium]HEX5289360.1 iron-containing alcohol dehydrogenase [Streptosporangiaceae bacterium]
MSQLDRFVITAKPAVHVGPGAIGELPGIVLAAGADQVVVVTEEALATAPVIETVLAVLADAGLPARLFAGVHSVPAPADLAGGADAVAEAAADAATAAAASASAAAVAAMLRPSAPLVAPSHPSGPHPVLRPLAPSPPPGPHRVLYPSTALPALAGPRIVLVAVGSGAPIDAAKGIAIAAACPPPGRDPGARPDGTVPALPIVAVPVATGTGAETSAVGLIADPADGRTFSVGHDGTMPAAAILDPELAAGLAPAVIAAGGLDALTRALESYLALRPNPWSDGIALQVIRMVAASLPRAVMDGTDLAAQSQLLLAAHMAGVATASTGLGLCHAIGRSVSTRWDVARGAALAMLLPEVLRFNLPARLERMADVAFALGVGDTHADTWPNAEAAIGAVTALRDDVGLNRLMGDFGITAADFAPICADALADEALASTPRPPTEADIHAILLAVSGHPR